MQEIFRVSIFMVEKMTEAFKWVPTLTIKFDFAVSLHNVTLESSVFHAEQRKKHRVYRKCVLEFYFFKCIKWFRISLSILSQFHQNSIKL
jgi:hypothetical protein